MMTAQHQGSLQLAGVTLALPPAVAMGQSQSGLRPSRRGGYRFFDPRVYYIILSYIMGVGGGGGGKLGVRLRVRVRVRARVWKIGKEQVTAEEG